MHKNLLALLRKAKVRLVISQAMAEEYKKRYGFDFYPFHNPVDLEAWSNLNRNESATRKTFRFVYTGRIGMANAQSLRDIATAISGLHSSEFNICFEIYSCDYKSSDIIDVLEENVVIAFPPVTHDQIPALLFEADGLILPLDFDEEAKKYALFSIPTKATEYMASGTPVLLFAPHELAITKYAESEGWAVIVSERNMSKLHSAIEQIYCDKSLRLKIGQQAKNLAFNNHNKKNIQETFQKTLLHSLSTKND